MLPPERSLKSWIILSNGAASVLDDDDDEEEKEPFDYNRMDNRKILPQSSSTIK